MFGDPGSDRWEIRLVEPSDVLDFQRHFHGQIREVEAYFQRLLANPTALLRVREQLARNRSAYRLLALSVPELVRELARRISHGDLVLMVIEQAVAPGMAAPGAPAQPRPASRPPAEPAPAPPPTPQSDPVLAEVEAEAQAEALESAAESGAPFCDS